MSVTGLPVDGSGKSFFGHPRGLMTLFLTEMWERFSFYGMRALLTLYLVAPPDGVTPPGGGLGISSGDATAIYGTYLALVYVTPLAGGWVADRMWGPRRAVLVGGIVIAGGHFLMAIPGQQVSFWLGLLLIAAGTGLLKPCVSCLVGGLYDTGDESRRDAGFSIFYMGINLGAFTAPLVCGFLYNNFNWHVGFAAAGFGMLFGVAQYLIGSKTLGDVGVAVPNPAPPEVRRRVFGLTGLLLVIVVALVAAFSLVRGGFSITDIVDVLTIIILVLPIIYFRRVFSSGKLTDVEHSRMRAFLVLFLASAVFWMIFDQAGSTLNIFAQENTDRNIGNFEMPAAFLQSVDPILVIIFAPIFAALWTKLGDRAPSTALKFAFALVGIGLSFVVMVIPGLAADGGELASVWWLIGVYVIQCWAELLLSPTGLSATTRLAPAGMGSQLLALWFLSVSVGDTIGGQLARGLDSLGLAPYFGILGSAAILCGLILLLASPKVRHMMAGVE